MGDAGSAAYSAIPFSGVIPIPPREQHGGPDLLQDEVSERPLGSRPRHLVVEANARLNGELPTRTAYSRFGRVVEVAIDMGRTSQPLSVFNERKVNCVGRKENPAGFFTMMPWVWGVSWLEATTVVSTA